MYAVQFEFSASKLMRFLGAKAKAEGMTYFLEHVDDEFFWYGCRRYV